MCYVENWVLKTTVTNKRGEMMMEEKKKLTRKNKKKKKKTKIKATFHNRGNQ